MPLVPLLLTAAEPQREGRKKPEAGGEGGRRPRGSPSPLRPRGSMSPDMGDRLPAGLRFHPTDQELVAHLYEKLNGCGGDGGGQLVPFLDVLIPTVDLYGDAADPWRVCQQLAYVFGMGSTEFYSFTSRRQRNGGSYPDRTAGSGTWTANGRDKGIYDRGVLIGHKTHLTFKIPPPPGSNIAGRTTRKSEMVNTHWVMHEYRLHRPGFQKMVVCRVHNQKKEREEVNPQWSPPWWEQQEGGCRSGEKRKAAPSCEDAAVPTQKQQRLDGGDAETTLTTTTGPVTPFVAGSMITSGTDGQTGSPSGDSLCLDRDVCGDGDAPAADAPTVSSNPTTKMDLPNPCEGFFTSVAMVEQACRRPPVAPCSWEWAPCTWEWEQLVSQLIAEEEEEAALAQPFEYSLWTY